MAPAPTNQTFERVTHFRFRGMRILVEQSFCSQHPAVEAVAALKRLFVDECLLDRVRIFRSAEPFKGDDFFSGRSRDWQEAGTNRAVIHMDAAGAALSQAASEARIIQGEIVSKDVEKGAIGVRFDRVRLAVYLERCARHLDLDSCRQLPRASLLLMASVKKAKWNFSPRCVLKLEKSPSRFCDG